MDKRIRKWIVGFQERTLGRTLPAFMAAFGLLLPLCGSSAADDRHTNLFPNPGFERFEDNLPKGWTATVWNRRMTRVTYGPLEPGRIGTGRCLVIPEASPMGVVTLRTPPFPIMARAEYVLKGHYSSNCKRVTTTKNWSGAEGVELVGTWLAEDSRTLGSFTIILPDTQDRWIEFFEEIRAPEGAEHLRLAITRRWTGGRLRFDDFSLRPGTINDYKQEFSIDAGDETDFFPVYGWLIPFSGILKHGHHKEMTQGPVVSEARLLAEYALANFALGNEDTARFGTRFWAGVPEADNRLTEITKNPHFWGYKGPDEPGRAAFSKLAEVNERIQNLVPNTIYWVNHLPTYGFGDKEFEAFEEYRQFLQEYVDKVKPLMFTYDHYCLLGPQDIQEKSWYSPNREQSYFANLEVARDEALKAGIPFGQIVGVGTFGGVRGASEGELRWQAFTSLAYGARSLGWFCYLTEVPYGNWTNWEDMVINRDGSRTRHYAMLKYLNAEILRWGPTLNRLSSIGVFHTEPLPPLTRHIRHSKLLASISGGMALAGEFVDPRGESYVMIVNRDFRAPAALRVKLREQPSAISMLSRETGEWKRLTKGQTSTDTVVILDLAPGTAELLRLEQR